MEPKIIFEDNHLLIVNKPNGIATQPNLEEWGKKKMGRPYLHAVHRLDKAASGIVVLAKTSKALSRLQKEMREGNFEKIYIVIIEGILSEKEGIFEDYLVHGSHKASVSKKGKLSVLNYKVLKEKDDLSLVEVTLQTGRYHQIRIQFASRGHPVLGDKKYDSKKDFMGGIALHHQRVSFPHPISNQIISFTSPSFVSWLK